MRKNVPAKADAGTSLAIPQDAMFEEFAGAGFENITANDLLVPRLAILQALSPQLNKREAAYIEGAGVGDICDVGTGEVMPQPLMFLPVYYRKEYLEWAPRNTGKGLVQVHLDATILDKTTRNERNQPVLANGNYIAETAQFYGLNLSAGRRKCFLPMTSSQLKKARKWITLATAEKLKRSDGSEYVAPIFYRVYELSTADESNAEGNWAGWVVNRGPSLPEFEFDGISWADVGHEAVAFRTSLINGEVRADVNSMEEVPLNAELM